jgi:hypothetical protein
MNKMILTYDGKALNKYLNLSLFSVLISPWIAAVFRRIYTHWRKEPAAEYIKSYNRGPRCMAFESRICQVLIWYKNGFCHLSKWNNDPKWRSWQVCERALLRAAEGLLVDSVFPQAPERLPRLDRPNRSDGEPTLNGEDYGNRSLASNHLARQETQECLGLSLRLNAKRPNDRRSAAMLVRLLLLD